MNDELEEFFRKDWGNWKGVLIFTSRLDGVPEPVIRKRDIPELIKALGFDSVPKCVHEYRMLTNFSVVGTTTYPAKFYCVHCLEIKKL